MSKKKVIVPEPPASPEVADDAATPPAGVQLSDPSGAPCSTCGTIKSENRCAVCGHQEHDT
jgi:hypothetical protein